MLASVAHRVVGNILSVIQSIDRQQQDVNTKKVSRLLAYVCICFRASHAPLQPHGRRILTTTPWPVCSTHTRKYGSNIPRAVSVELMKWAETTVSVTVEDVLAEFPKHLRTQATQHVYKCVQLHGGHGWAATSPRRATRVRGACSADRCSRRWRC